VNKLSLLVNNKNLRKEIGKAGRLTAKEKYSIKFNQKIFMQVLKNVIK